MDFEKFELCKETLNHLPVNNNQEVQEGMMELVQEEELKNELYLEIKLPLGTFSEILRAQRCSRILPSESLSSRAFTTTKRVHIGRRGRSASTRTC